MQSSRVALTGTIVETAVALVLFGCIPVVIRYVSANPYTIGIFRLAVASAGVFVLMPDRAVLRGLRKPDILGLVVIGALFFAHWLTYFLSIKVSSASIGTIGLSTYGVHLLILGALFGRTRLHVVDIVAVLLAVAGAVMTVSGSGLRSDATLGMLLGTVSALLYASLPILHQRYARMSSSVRALGQFSFALLFFLLFVTKADWNLRPIDWAGLAFLALGSTLVGHTLWVRVTTRLSPATTSLVYYGSVPIAIALSVSILHEPLAPRTAIGAAFIICGGVLGLASQWRRGVAQAGEASGLAVE